MNRLSWLLVTCGVLALGAALAQTQSSQWFLMDWDISKPCPNSTSAPWSARWCSDGLGHVTLSQNGSTPLQMGLAPVPGPAGKDGLPGANGKDGLPGASGAPGASGICLAGQTTDGALTIDTAGVAHFKVATPCH